MTTEQRTLVQLESVSFAKQGRTLTAQIQNGEKYAVMGPIASGKSWFLQCIAQSEKPERGSITLNSEVAMASEKEYGRRATAANLARAFAKGLESGKVVEVLTHLKLWDIKDQLVHKLTPGQIVLVDLLPCFLSESETILIDGHLDFIDPWTLEDILELIEAQSIQGKAFFITTSRADIAEALGNLIVLKSGTPKFAGTVQELIKSSDPLTLHVELDDPSTVLSMIDPFVIYAKAGKKQIELSSHQGQELAAKLLTYGYGNVKSVVMRTQTVEEAIKSII